MYIESRGYLPQPLPDAVVQETRSYLDPTRVVTHESMWGELGSGPLRDRKGIFHLSIIEKLNRKPSVYVREYSRSDVESRRSGEKSFWAAKALEWLPRKRYPMEIIPGVGVAIYRAQDPNHEPVDVITPDEMYPYDPISSSRHTVDPGGFIPNLIDYLDDEELYASKGINDWPRYRAGGLIRIGGSGLLTYDQFMEELRQGEQSKYWMNYNAAACNPVIRVTDPQMVGKSIHLVALEKTRPSQELDMDAIVLSAENFRLVEREVIYPFLDAESYRMSLEKERERYGFIKSMYWQSQQNLVDLLKRISSR